MWEKQLRSGAVLLLGVALFLCTGCGKIGWREYDSPNGGYAAEFPGTPTIKTQGVPTPLGEISTNITVVETRDWAYSVIHADMPAIVETAPPKAVLEGAKQGIGGKGIKITKSQEMTLFGKPALELFGQDDQNRRMRVRLFLVKNRMYQIIIAAGSDNLLTDADAERFFASFKLK